MPWQAKYLLLALIWGSSFLLMKVGLRTMAPLQISGLRIFAGTATLLGLLADHRWPAARASAASGATSPCPGCS